MPNVLQAPPPSLQELADRLAALEEAIRRMGAAAGEQYLLPVPSSPGYRHLWPVPPLPA